MRGQVGNALPRAGLSNALIVEIAEQHYVLGRALGQIAERFGLPDATVTASLQRVGKLLQPCLGQLIALYRAAAARHADNVNVRLRQFRSKHSQSKSAPAARRLRFQCQR